MGRTLVVWCPDWPVAAAGIVDGIDTLKPVVVLAANRVIACSAAARAEGIRLGLRKRETQARCPDIIVVERDESRDARAFEAVVSAVEEIAPGVDLVRPGVCALHARGPASYFGGEEAAAEHIVEQIAQVAGVEAQVGIAEGVFAAGLAARTGRIVAPGATPAFLADFDIAAIGSVSSAGSSSPAGSVSSAGSSSPAGSVSSAGSSSPAGSVSSAGSSSRVSAGGRSAGSDQLVDLLRRLGIRTLGAFAALPAADVLTRFGFVAALAHRLAGGQDERPLAVRQPPADLDVTQVFEEPLDRVDAAAFAARALAEKLHGKLSGHGLACTRLGIEAVTERGEELHRTWRHDGLLGAAAIADRVRWQLDGWLNHRTGRPTGGIVRLRLEPDGILAHAGLQLGLWGDVGAERDRAHRAMVRVQGILGPEGVVTAVLGGGRDPAAQVQLVPWGDERLPSRPPEPPWPGRLPAPAPATVLPEPVPVDVTDAGGQPVRVTARLAVTGAPARLSQDLEAVDITGWAGPWPVDERWWDPMEAVRKARFQVSLSDGRALLLRLSEGAWAIEAIYD
jgi:protein ImuB